MFVDRTMRAKKIIPCPACGKDIPAQAKACHHCGACEKSGWNADSSDGLDLPEEDFDYEKFTQEEFGQPRRRQGKERLVWVTALILLIVMAVLTGYNWLFGQ